MKDNILVLDDEESIRFSFHRFLTAEGYQVTTAASYGEALARMDEMKFHLILADIILDDGYGLDILEEVLRRSLKTQVIIMTAYPSKETMQQSFHQHASDYLVKPLRQQGLLDAVMKALACLECSTDNDFGPH
jgi:DNA-binding NtrC family response regulator